MIHGDWVNSIPKDKKYDGIFVDLWDEHEDYTRRKVLSDTLDISGTVNSIVVTGLNGFG